MVVCVVKASENTNKSPGTRKEGPHYFIKAAAAPS